MQEININTARHFILKCQGLAEKSNHTKSVINRLGYIQIDTISVVNRAHHHVIWGRNPQYQLQELHQLIENRQIFEYWAHAAAYLPIEHYRFSLYPKSLIAQGPGHWHKKDVELMSKVSSEIRQRGPLQARDFVKDSNEESIPWLQHPIHQAIRQLYMEGIIMIQGRKGFQKIYELTERLLPDLCDLPIPNRSEYLNFLLHRDLRAHGLLTLKELGYLLKIKKTEWIKLLNQKLGSKEITKIQIAGIQEEYFCLTNKLEELLDTSPHRKRLHLLSPFDNMLIQRARISRLFNFNYTLECYVPAKKRKVGYFCLPILWGIQFIGQIDLKAHRKERVLEVKNLIWENKKRIPEAAFRKKMTEFMLFNGCETIKWKDS